MTVYRGVVRGKTAVLDEPTGLADGSIVEVRPLESPAESQDSRQREEVFKQHLIERGLLDRIRRPESEPNMPDHTPIPILGGPLVSETLIEDRR